MKLWGLMVLALLLPGSAAHAEQWALLVGVDHYEDVNHISPLSTADADARALAKVLAEIRGVPATNIQVLTSTGEKKPTRANIIEALSRLASNLKPGDTAFVFFSGHGTQIEGKTYLLPYDFRGRDAFAGVETALATEKISGLLQKATSATIVLGWDMCRNDPFAASKSASGGRNRMPPPSKKAWQTTAGSAPAALRVVELFACSPGQCSYEWRDRKRGYFSYYLEQGLRGAAADSKGQITALGLADFVTKRVSQSVKRDENETQMPYPQFFGPGTPSLVLARADRKGPVPEPRPVETAPIPTPTPTPAPKTPQPGEWLPGNDVCRVRIGKWEERAGSYVYENKRVEHSWRSGATSRAEFLDTEVKPKPKNKIIVVPCEVKNVSRRPRVLWWFHDTADPTRINTDEETSADPYYEAVLFDINKESDLPRSADIEPDATLKFNIVFSIPENEQPRKLLLKFNMNSDKVDIKLDLTKK
jgi:uncharacterized caspase-like protein